MQTVQSSPLYADWVRVSLFCKPHFLHVLSPIHRHLDYSVPHRPVMMMDGLVLQFEYTNKSSIIQVTGSSFLTNNYNADLAAFIVCLEKIEDMYTMSGFKPFYDVGLTRLDLAFHCDPISLESIDFVNAKGSNKFVRQTKYEVSDDLTGIAIGRRAPDSIFFRAYQKALDPNSFNAAIRFGTSNFTRFEWEFGSKILRELVYTDTVMDLLKYDVELLSDRAKSYVRPIIQLNPTVWTGKTKKRENGTYVHALKSVQSMMSNHLTADELDIVRISAENLMEEKE